MKLYPVLFLLISIFTACNGRSNTGQEAQLLMLASQREAIATNTGTAETRRVYGEIPYRPYWAYHNDKSDQDFAAFFDGELEQNPNFGPSGHSQVQPNEMWLPFPDEMETTLEEIHFYDWKGKPRTPVKTYFIERGSWKRIEGPAFTGEKYKAWDKHKLDRPLNVAYLVFKTSDRVFPTEIKLIGSYRPHSPKPFKRKEIKIKDMLGVNGYIWNFQQPSGRGNDPYKFKLAAPFTMVRDYVDWEKIEYFKGVYTFSPVYRGAWDYDAYYAGLKERNIEPLVCFKTVPEWFLEQNYPKDLRDSENAPCRWTSLPAPTEPHPKDYRSPAAYEAAKTAYEQQQAAYEADIAAIRLDPASYTDFGKVAFQFIARYGSNKNLDPKLVSPFAGNRNPKFAWIAQKKKIGLGYVKAIECNNEPNAWWKGRKRYQTAREYAANLSAFYDGHMGTLGPGVGVKNADPNVLVVMGGIIENSPAYVQGIIDWCKENRGYREDGSVNLCFDVANFHSYANNGGGQYSNSSWGIPPELSEAAEIEAWSFLQVLSEVGNDVPVYVTETGYGVNEGSSQQAMATATRTKIQSHADWTIRNSLFYARAGISKLYHYQMYDETSYVNDLKKGKQGRGTYAALGLLDKMNYTRRPAANYIVQLSNQFGEYTYKETIHKDPIVDVYELKGKKMYALVVPDMQGRTAEYELVLNSPYANIYEFVDDAEKFKVKKVKTRNGKLRITVTETPVFVDSK